MKFLDIACPSCGARVSDPCQALVPFTNKTSGEKKIEWRQIPEVHKERKQAVALELMKAKRQAVSSF